MLIFHNSTISTLLKNRTNLKLSALSLLSFYFLILSNLISSRWLNTSWVFCFINATCKTNIKFRTNFKFDTFITFWRNFYFLNWLWIFFNYTRLRFYINRFYNWFWLYFNYNRFWLFFNYNRFWLFFNYNWLWLFFNNWFWLFFNYNGSFILL